MEGLELFGPNTKFGLLPEIIPLFSIRSQNAALVYEEEQNESLPKHQESALLGSLLQWFWKPNLLPKEVGFTINYVQIQWFSSGYKSTRIVLSLQLGWF